MLDEGTLREWMRRGDALVASGDVDGAVAQYLLCVELDERSTLLTRAPSVLRRAALRREVLRLVPTRTDVRRALADDYLKLGLLDDARDELMRAAEDAATRGEHEAR